MKARSVSDVIAGEAVSGTPEERFNDMLHIASVIKNRADMLGVTPEQVIAGDRQFDAYNKQLPDGVEGEIVDMAAKAWEQVNTIGPVTDATYYATRDAIDGLPSTKEFATETTGHQYFTEPTNGAIKTSIGFKKPNPTLMSEVVSPAVDQMQNVASSAYDTTAGFLGNAYNTGADLVGKTGGMGMGILDRGVNAATNAVESTRAGLSSLLSDKGQLSFNHPQQEAGLDPSMRGVLDSVAAQYPGGLDITSAYRSPSYNQNIGGARNSYHTQGLAADIDMTGMDENQRSMLVDRLNERGVGGLITYANQPNMLHVDMRQTPTGDPHMMYNKTAALLDNAPDWFKAKALAQNNPNYPTLTGVEPAPMLPVDTAPVPTLLDRSSLQINQPDQMMAAVNPPIDNSVVRTGLPDVAPSQGILSNGWQDMAAANQAKPAVAAINAQMTPKAMPSYAELTAPTALETAAAEEFGPRQLSPQTVQDFNANPFAQEALAPNIGILSTNVPMATPSLPTATGQTIAGPATTEIASAPVQQQKAAVTQAVKQASAPVTQAQQPGILTKVNDTLGTNLTKESLAGGLLGGMTLGPIGGLLGALAGNYVAKNGGLGGLFSGLGQPISVNNIGGGLSNVQSVYSSNTPGTQANTNNGGRVTSLPGGRVAYTSPSGVVTVSNADGTGQGSYFGSTKF